MHVYIFICICIYVCVCFTVCAAGAPYYWLEREKRNFFSLFLTGNGISFNSFTAESLFYYFNNDIKIDCWVDRVEQRVENLKKCGNCRYLREETLTF